MPGHPAYFGCFFASQMPTTADNNQAHLRHLPKVHALLESEHAHNLMANVPRQVVLDAL